MQGKDTSSLVGPPCMVGITKTITIVHLGGLLRLFFHLSVVKLFILPTNKPMQPSGVIHYNTKHLTGIHPLLLAYISALAGYMLESGR